MPAPPDLIAAVLAAGASRRLGRPKQLVEIDGIPLVRRAALACLAVTDTVLVVTGHEAFAVASALAELPVRVVHNDRHEEGMGTSIACAARVAGSMQSASLLLSTCDQVALDAPTLARLVQRHQLRDRERTRVASQYGDVRGVPAIFPPEDLPALSALTGDRGARALLGDAMLVDWPEGALDLDTPADLERLGAA
jgi:CTP:molybdopterin cytidylyltransferase MocA